MNRELGYRVWDKKTKEFRPVRSFSFNQNGELSTVETVDPVTGHDPWTQDIDEVILEPYTGLKDKNGKKIYKGDIVNLEYYEKPHGKKRWVKTYPHKGGKDINVVDFEDGYFKFHQEDKDGYGSELFFSDYGEWESRDCKYKYEAEVIGNVHENQELLEGKK